VAGIEDLRRGSSRGWEAARIPPGSLRVGRDPFRRGGRGPGQGRVERSRGRGARSPGLRRWSLAPEGWSGRGSPGEGEPLGEASDELPLAPREAAFVRLEGKP